MSQQTVTNVTSPGAPPLETLEAIQRRVLWLATRMIHDANHVRPNPDGVKVGGHQASSRLGRLDPDRALLPLAAAGDRVAVKPHASPGLPRHPVPAGQPRPRVPDDACATSAACRRTRRRTKDPDPVDFSTGSVGLGAVGAALRRRSPTATCEPHFGGSAAERRFVALIGDAELDEGNVWEAISRMATRGLGNVTLDRRPQPPEPRPRGAGHPRRRSSRRCSPTTAGTSSRRKYGRRLRAAFALARRRGAAPAHRRHAERGVPEHDPAAGRRGPRRPARPARGRRTAPTLARVRGRVSRTTTCRRLLGDLGGPRPRRRDRRPRGVRRRGRAGRRVVFAYTIKGWGLPIAGDPLNHSALLSPQQIDALREALGDRRGRVGGASTRARRRPRCAARSRGAAAEDAARPPIALAAPDDAGRARRTPVAPRPRRRRRSADTLQRPGARRAGRSASGSSPPRPDVAISTNLGGWINRVGVFAPTDAARLRARAGRAAALGAGAARPAHRARHLAR